MDDFVERLWKTLAFVCVAFLLIYFLIATSSERPRGLSLVIFSTMNLIFYWLLRLIVVGLIGCILFFAYSAYSHDQIEAKRKLQDEERRREEAVSRRAYEAEVTRKKRLHEEAKDRQCRKARREEQDQKNQKEKYLKNRSAKEANDNALKNFL